MRIRRLRIIGFGPFAHQAMDLAPGLTVLYGLNEAGKSTWHAALYAALCGMRRGRGASTIPDRLFADRHRPWGGGPWEVGADLELADGRRIEVRHDLDGKVACSARDELGRDVSGEIIFEGSPDASRWLGLDRRAFLATACVRQSEVLNVREDAGSLQEHLQRAAATAGTDATAARALDLIENAIRDRVGRDAANSVKPLRRAVDRESVAARRLAEVRDAHGGYLDLLGRVRASRANAEEATQIVREIEAAAAEFEAREGEVTLGRVECLLASHADGPPSAVQDEALATEVATALSSWRARPSPPNLDGESADDLRAALAALPPPPAGDLEPAADVVTGLAAMRAARSALDAHLAGRPQEVLSSVTLTAAELEDLARRIEEPVPARDEALRHRVEAAREAVTSTIAPWSAYALLGGAAALLLSAAVTVAAGLWPLGVAGVVGMLVAGWLGISRLRSAGPHARLVLLRDLEEQQARADAVVDAAEGRKQSALASIRSHGLSVEPAELRALAASVETAARERYLAQQWDAQWKVLAQRVSDCAGHLYSLRRWNGEVHDYDDLDAAAECYFGECRSRAQQAREAARREGFERQLRMREKIEEEAEVSRQAAIQAEGRLRRASDACGMTAAAGPDQTAEGLDGWLSARASRVVAAQAATTEWSELQTLLAGRNPDRLREEVATTREHADRLALAIGRPQGVEPDADAQATLQERRSAAQVAAEEAANLEGRLSTIDPASVDVVAAEEELLAAQAELDRVRRLERVLTRTKSFLEVAQDRVHRDIAPVLTATLRRWLPQVTGGRWVDATVDPENLLVHVRVEDGHWRQAPLLSEGTREQIYLLLRMAMVKHLTRPGEACPLILDDVTIHSDAVRKRGLLDLLLAISKERQVILFAQEQEVRDWAETCLNPPGHRLHILGEVAVAT